MKTKILVFLLCAFLNLPSAYIFTAIEDVYTIKALEPGIFFIIEGTRALNNSGKVAGYRVTDGYVGTQGSKPSMWGDNIVAACWDIEKGMISLEKKSHASFSCSLNDEGFIAVGIMPIGLPTKEYHLAYQPRSVRAALWNPITAELKLGPLGIPYAINNSNIMLLGINPGKRSVDVITTTLWSSKKNAIIELGKFYTGISNIADISDTGIGVQDVLYSVPSSEIPNKNKSVLYQATPEKLDLMLFYDGAKHLLLPKKGELVPGQAHLNNKDEVVSLTVINEANKKTYFITQWKKNGDVGISESLTKAGIFVGNFDFKIAGFNDKGQILLEMERISADVHVPHYVPHYLLFTPKQN